jgi:hypothetical protein
MMMAAMVGDVADGLAMLRVAVRLHAIAKCGAGDRAFLTCHESARDGADQGAFGAAVRFRPTELRDGRARRQHQRRRQNRRLEFASQRSHLFLLRFTIANGMPRLSLFESVN